MPRLIALLLLLLTGLLLPAGEPVAAADAGSPPMIWRYNAQGTQLPFPRSERAQAVWDAGACWSECGAYCAWSEAGCLATDGQGRCIRLTDRCDRYCQRSCRTRGGPFVPIE